MGRPLQHLPPLDVPISILDQTPPNTAGPVGRLVSMINCQVTKYLGATATPGVATGARVKLEQREAFRALTTTTRSSVDGSVVTPAWGPAQLLDSLDEQLVSINNSVPRVKTDADWTAYLGSRVVTRKLQQSVMHTANGIMQAQDSAWLSGVTFVAWRQKTTVYVGVRSDNGAWVVPPQIAAFTSTMPKVVSDGVNFWLFYNDGTNFVAAAYDTHGVLLGQNNVTAAAAAATVYDITARSPGVLFATSGAASHILFASVTISGSTVTVTTSTDATTSTTNCLGFLRNPINALAYLASGNGTALNVYEVTALAATHTYAMPALFSSTVDSLIGWVNSSLTVFVTSSFLSNVVQGTGPPFDPRYRRMVTTSCTTGGATATVKTQYSIVPVSRAFQVDDDWYAVTYYQGGPGITASTGAQAVTWTSGDFMKGAAVQDLAFHPGAFQYGFDVTINRAAGNPDSVTVSGGVANYAFGTPPAEIMALGQTYASLIYANGGQITIGGASHGGNNDTFTVNTITLDYANNAIFLACTATTQVTENFGGGVTSTLTSPAAKNSTWYLPGVLIDPTWVGENLYVNGTSQPANFGANPIFSVSSSTVTLQPPGSVDLQPEVIPNPVQPTAVLQLQLADPTTAYEFFLQSVTFDLFSVGGLISVQGSNIPADDTVYQIVTLIDSHHVIATPLNLSTNQINRTFPSTVKISISFPTQSTASLQPTWFMTPLAVTTQQTVGRWEYGIAYADWRFDGQGTGETSATNTYPMDVTSVVPTTAGLQVVLPYRAESFSSGVTAPTGNPVDTFFSTVGLKAFTLSTDPGQSLAVSASLIAPGPQASEFTSSGFTEQGINLGPETPFFVSQSNDTGITLGLTPGTQYQYRICFECVDEDGDRIFTIPSQPLNVTLSSTNNTITLGGNLLQPTQRIVTIGIYRTSIAGGSTTVQHYKITNDTDPNGAGFTFPDIVTWNFKDQRPDSEILVSETLYTDKGFTPRYPCPAFIQGIGTWRNRTWVIGYDGAIWMSGEKSEGDAVWFTPLFRYVLPSDDAPTCLASMDDYLIILGAMSNWYIPGVQFPDATANPTSGQLPAPVQLPFANGCTGHAVTTRDGVIYSSTAGGVWLIPRNLTNGWLSQAIQSSLGPTNITGLAVDRNQRVLITFGGEQVYVWDTIPGAWYQWNIQTNATLVSAWQGHFVYSDGSRVNQHTPGVYADNIGASDIAIPPSWVLAPLHFMGSVRGYGRCWAFQLQGEYMGPHFMNLTLGYGDEGDYQAPTVFPPFAALSNKSYLYEWNPREEEASQFEIAFTVTFPNGVAGNSATWELLSFDVGVDQGIARVSPAKRVSSG